MEPKCSKKRGPMRFDQCCDESGYRNDAFFAAGFARNGGVLFSQTTACVTKLGCRRQDGITHSTWNQVVSRSTSTPRDTQLTSHPKSGRKRNRATFQVHITIMKLGREFGYGRRNEIWLRLELASSYSLLSFPAPFKSKRSPPVCI